MATNQQVWIPDTHPENLHTTWEPEDPDTHVCIGVHVHPDQAGRHFLATPSKFILDGQRHAVPGAKTHRTPEGHVTILDLGHCARIYDAIIAENRLKNNARATLVQALPEWMKRQQQHQGFPLWIDEQDRTWIQLTKNRWMQPGNNEMSTDPGPLHFSYDVIQQFSPRWKFDVTNGTVSFSVPGLTAEEHEAIEPIVRAVHGEAVSVRLG